MSAVAKSPLAELFFLPGSVGDLSAIYHPPSDSVADRGDVIHLHSFAQELPNARPIVAHLARELAKSGVGVLLVDMLACGDSAGEFREARWNIWKQDVLLMVQWLRQRGRQRISLWGLRLGALLLLDVASEAREPFEKLILCQAVLSGEELMTQFLRLRVAFSGMKGVPGKRETTRDLRQRLASGECLEVAGYELAPELVGVIDNLRFPLQPQALAGELHWLELVPEPGAALSEGSMRVIKSWQSAGAKLTLHPVVAKPFWVHTRGSVNEYGNLLAALKAVFGDRKS